MVIEVRGNDGTSAYLDPDDVGLVMPAIDGSKAALPREQDGIAIVGRSAPEVVGSIVKLKSGPQVAIDELPASIAARINARTVEAPPKETAEDDGPAIELEVG